MKQFMSKLNNTRTYLIVANILLVFFLILLFNVGVLPFRGMGDFAFFTMLVLILALYRPGWGFLFFVGTIALENINLAPDQVGIMIRPYQFFGGLTVVAIAIRLIARRLNFKLINFSFPDYAVALIAITGFVNVLGAMNKGLSLKLSIILTSFVFLYLLTRNYIQTANDLKKIIPFFLSSGIIVVLYGLWQNIMFMNEWKSFEVMPGRPNATFAEPDWLGMYLVLLIATIYALLYFLRSKKYYAEFEENKNILARFNLTTLNLKFFSLYVYLLPTFILLIITVSRSAWLGFLVVTFVYWLVTLTGLSFNIRDWQWKNLFNQAGAVVVIFIVSLVGIYLFNLTNFQLANRVQSTGTGLQKIAIACQEIIDLPKNISNVSELEKYNCRHINLEEIEEERMAGNFISEIYRNDPNINVRREIYKKSWNEIKKHPILGIGWGNIGTILGNDERGAGLNSSNIFLEIWLGAGIIGLLAFLAVTCYVFFKSARLIINAENNSKILGLFLLLGSLAIIIPNLFNAGIFLGFLWVFFGINKIK